MADLSDTIEDAAGKPKSATADGQSAESRPMTDLIEADKYLAGKGALSGVAEGGGPRSGWNALRPARVVPPGGV